MPPFPSAVGPCISTNLWQNPDTPASHWDDFNYFFGEKDFTWARQWVAEKSDDPLFMFDNTKIVSCGTSAGATYSAFLGVCCA